MSKAGATVSVQDRTQQLRGKIADAVSKAVLRAAVRVQAGAKRRILQGPKTGRVYTQRFARLRGRVVPVGPRAGANLSPAHQASAPGQSPASDTGNLQGTIVLQAVRIEPGRISAGVVVQSPYALALEYGAPRARIQARPFLAPTLAELRDQILRDLTAALRGAAT